MPSAGDDPHEHVGAVAAGARLVVVLARPRAGPDAGPGARHRHPATGAVRTRRAATSRSNATSSSSGGSSRALSGTSSVGLGAEDPEGLELALVPVGAAAAEARRGRDLAARLGVLVAAEDHRDLAGGGLAPVRQPLGRGRRLVDGLGLEGVEPGVGLRPRSGQRAPATASMRSGCSAVGSSATGGLPPSERGKLRSGRAAGSGRAGTSPKRGSDSAIRRPARPESSLACASSAPMIRTPSPAGAGRAAGCSRVSRSSS